MFKTSGTHVQSDAVVDSTKGPVPNSDLRIEVFLRAYTVKYPDHTGKLLAPYLKDLPSVWLVSE